MRILLHDFGGFSYPWQLSRSLAQRGHVVHHVFSTGEPARAVIDVPAELAERLTAVGLAPPRPLPKRSFLARRAWELEYGAMVPKEIDQFRPEVVISANSPILAQDLIFRHVRRQGARFLFWVQDLMSVAAYGILKRKLSVFGAMVGRHHMRIEGRLLRDSDQIVLITEDFQPYLDRWKVPRDRTHVIENWAPIEQLPRYPKQNDWSRQHGLHDKRVLMYAGTLGLKHDPHLLVHLAKHVRRWPDVRVVVAAEGSGVPLLKAAMNSQQLDNVILMPFQSFDKLPQVLSSADGLVALLEPDGAKYCVPSKVLTYLCSGRPILVSVVPDNLIARIVERNQAGLVTPPGDVEKFIQAAELLLTDEELRVRLGNNARAYAERQFDISHITDRFEALALNPSRSTPCRQ